MKLLASARNRWLLLAALWVVLLVLGVGGFLQQAGDGGFHRTFLDNLYLTMQLAALDYEGGDDALNWRLQVARFAAPVMAASTVLQTASLVFVEQYRQFRLRFASGHTIVCGLGDTGTRIAQAFAANGDTVVGIESDSTSAGVAAARSSDITVVIGDATDAETLKTARVGRAARLVCVSGDDAANLQISIAAADLPRSATAALRCAVHLAEAELATFLRSADLDASKQIRVTFFNVHERAARTLVAENPPFVDDTTANHVVVMGLGQLGRNLVIALAQAWADRRGDEPLPITLVDRVASGRWEAMCMQHPALREVCAPTVFDVDLGAPRSDDVDRLRIAVAERRPSWVCMAFEDESLALSTALFAQRGLGINSAPIVVRTRTESGLGALIHGHTSAGKSNLQIFPFLERTCTVAAVDAGIREQLARAVHEQYLADATDAGGSSDLRRPWDDLADEQRDPSRRRVDGLIGDLDSLGYSLVPLRRWGAPVVELTGDEVAGLAEREHERWRVDRTAAGWTWAPVRDNVAKHNPLLVGWADLSADARRVNVDAARALPAMLARAGYEPVRNAPII
jgi:voltage-gated potassium channel Kch